MLILTRRVGESVQLGDTVTVTVTQVKGGQVKLSFEAPRTIDVVRLELLAKSAKG